MTMRRAQRVLRSIPVLLLLLVPLRLTGQQQVAGSVNWADDVLKQESYQTPPKELADAVLAPRQLNMTLSSLSPDKKWFLEERPDGPVEMKIYLYPYEDHGPVAKETLLDLWARWAAWLDKYVKNPEKKIDRKSTTDQQQERR